MPSHRFFLPQPFNQEKLLLTFEESHHLQNVMKVRQGEPVEIVNGMGFLAQGRVETLDKSGTTICLMKQSFTPKGPYELILAQALIRPSLLDWVIEKGTELGVTQFWLYPGECSEKKELSAQQLERLHHLMIGALKQSGRLYLPQIQLKDPLSYWKKPGDLLLFGSLTPQAVRLEPVMDSSVIIAIGPEKGFSHHEEKILHRQLGGKGIQLHTNTLRTETAAICALSLLSYAIKL
ncbi:MAG: RsmE family RNA methyltransferase [Candidatus Rhabdochlamydia sp.]